MKPIRSILLLSVVVICIIVFWLKPGINTAKDATYVRYYEDTEKKIELVTPADTVHKQRQRKFYRSEGISTRDKLSKISPRKFSRALQFEDSVYVAYDSVPAMKIVASDSVSSK